MSENNSGKSIAEMQVLLKLLGRIKEVDVTDRQKEVLSHLLLGKTNKEIALSMGLSEATVKLHLSRTYKKFGVSNRVQMFSIASHLEL